MRYVLIPHEIPETWTLNEVLYWAAFRHFPCGHNSDVDSLYLGGGMRVYCPHEEQIAFGTNTFEPRLKELFDSETIFEIEPWVSEHISDLHYNHQLEESSRGRRTIIKPVMDPLSELLDPVRAEVFVQLHRGGLVGNGILTHLIADKSGSKDWADNENWTRIEEVGQEVKPIPKDQWQPNGIIWHRNFAATPCGCYEGIRVSAAEVLKCFPEPQPESFEVENRGGTLIVADDVESLSPGSKKRRRGRPPIWDWGAFHQQVGIIAITEGLPKKMAALEATMREWCLTTYGWAPATSTVRLKLRSYYEALRKADK